MTQYTKMKALSVRQPWAYSILFGGKTHENRDWPTRVRGTIALHAGKEMSKYDFEAWYLFLSHEELHGDWSQNGRAALAPRGGVVGLVDIIDCTTGSDSLWFTGQFGFALANPRPLPEHTPLIRCSGKLGFFDLPEDVLHQIRMLLP